MTAQSRAIAAGLAAGLRYRGQTVTYSRLTASKTLTVMRGRTLQDQTTMPNMAAYATASAEFTDWIFLATELTGWTPATPVAGDSVVSGITTHVVTAAEDGRAWRYVDPDETWIRVHSVRT